MMKSCFSSNNDDEVLWREIKEIDKEASNFNKAIKKQLNQMFSCIKQKEHCTKELQNLARNVLLVMCCWIDKKQSCARKINDLADILSGKRFKFPKQEDPCGFRKLFEEVKKNEKKPLGRKTNNLLISSTVKFTSKDKLNQHVMSTILQTLAEMFGFEVDLNVFIKEYLEVFFGGGSTYESFNQSLLQSVTVVLAFFRFIFRGEQSQRLFAQAVETLKTNESLAGLNVYAVKDGMFLGKDVEMMFSLKSLIDNWTRLVNNNHETEASQSMRTTAAGILKMTQTLMEEFCHMKCKLEEMTERLLGKQKRRSKTNSLEDESGDLEQSDDRDESYDCEEIRVGLLNVRSLSNKEEKVKNLITENKLHVFLTTETWLDRDNAEGVLREASPRPPSKFWFFHQAREILGVAIISRALNPTHELKEIKQKTFGFVAAELQHEEWKDHVLFINVYRPPGLEQFDDFRKEFKEVLDKVPENVSVIVTGEILAGIRRFQNDFKDVLDRKGFDHHVKELTQDTEDLIISRNVEISPLQIGTKTSGHQFLKFQARPTGADENDEVKTIVLLNNGSVVIEPSTINDLINVEKPDILFATQTEKEDLKNGIGKHLEHQYWSCHSVWKKRGGGVAIQYSNIFHVQEKTKPNSNRKTFEYVAAELEHKEWKKCFLFINVYRPPGFSQFDAFLREFAELFYDLSEGYNSVIITGDFNIHVNKDTEHATKKFKKLLEELGLTQRVKKPTHRGRMHEDGRTEPHTLDLVITRNVEISDLTVHDDGISDHSTVYFTMRPDVQNMDRPTDRRIGRVMSSEL